MRKSNSTARLFWLAAGPAILVILALAQWYPVGSVLDPALGACPETTVSEQTVYNQDADDEDLSPDPTYEAPTTGKHLVKALPSLLGRIWRVQRRFVPTPAGFIDSQLELSALAVCQIVLPAAHSTWRPQLWLPIHPRGP